MSRILASTVFIAWGGVCVGVVFILGNSLVRKQLFEVLGQQLLLQGETNPGSRSPYISLDLPHVLNVSVKERERDGERKKFKFVFLLICIV